MDVVTEEAQRVLDVVEAMTASVVDCEEACKLANDIARQKAFPYEHKRSDADFAQYLSDAEFVRSSKADCYHTVYAQVLAAVARAAACGLDGTRELMFSLEK